MLKSRARTLLALLLPALLLTQTAAGRQPAPQQKATPPPQTGPPGPQPSPTPQGEATSSEDEVLRITSNLVQIDAVVTDGKGRRVPDLTPDDFEVIVDGRPQQLTNLSYVSEE